MRSAARVPEFVTLEDVARIIRAAAEGAASKGGLTECSSAALNSWAEVIERNLEAGHADAASDEFEPRVMRVDCSQFASCQWHGKRLVSKLGVQLDPCPKCGKEVVA